MAGDPGLRRRDPDFGFAMFEAAMTHLHREIAKQGIVRLSKADFDDYAEAKTREQGIQLDIDEASGDILLSHVQRDKGPVS